jgi:hypothetical protein
MHRVFAFNAIVFIFSLLFGKTHAIQDTDSLPKLRKFQKQFSFLMEAGPMIPRNTDWGKVVQDDFNYRAVDFRLGFKKIQPKLYNIIYRVPTFGFGFYTATFENQYVGKPHAVYLFADIPFPQSFYDNRLTFSYLTAVGVSFNLKPFDPYFNPFNQFIGSYENGYVHAAFNMQYKILPQISIDSSIGFKHFSNGSLKKPNTGLNFIPFSIGLRANLNHADFDQSFEREVPDFIPNNQVNFLMSIGGKNYEIGEGQYLKLGLGLNYMRQHNFKYRYGLGFEMFYSEAAALRNPTEILSFHDRTSFALAASWEWVLTRHLYVPIAFGTYLHRNYLNDEIKWYYQRIGIRYRLNNHIFAGVTIKAHGFKADFFEWTVGYTLFKDKNKY